MSTPHAPQGDPDDRRAAGRPAVIVFDVNETLSDMAPIARRFEDVGAPGYLAESWFAGLLRDGFALTVVGSSEPFARIGAEALRVRLGGLSLDRDLEDAVEHVMTGFATLRLHPDVVDGIHRLRALGIRLVTLSNGSASVAMRLLHGSGVEGELEALLSVEDAGAWKPAPAAYAHALTRCDVEAGDAMLVAVHPWDIDGAARAGLRTAWLDRTGSRYPAYFTAPEVAATSVADLADRLA